jgi:16S rRNA (cytosine1402-N4)-methyltransferase
MVSLVQGIWGADARADGVLLDLGISSRQVDATGFGFSFQHDEPLDMRFNPEADFPMAADIVNTWSESDLAAIIREYGEEPRARTIAAAIVRERPLHTTAQLARVVSGVLGRRRGRNPRGGGRRPTRTHPATRTFQALRIAVNDELGNLSAGLEGAVELLAPGGRVAVISYHSLEDRLVKAWMDREARQCVCPPELPVCACDHEPTVRFARRRVIRPSATETENNPRSRSARLRAVERI